MPRNINERIINEALYIIKTENTVRELANVFRVSKSTVHKDLHERLLCLDKALYNNVDRILKYHTDVRHIRGGESTKKKYLNETKSV
ncbi:MAG: sporulation transcriptional regulator SpoIIID [Bacilli bacterium]